MCETGMPGSVSDARYILCDILMTMGRCGRNGMGTTMLMYRTIECRCVGTKRAAGCTQIRIRQ